MRYVVFQKDDDLFMTHGTLPTYLKSKIVHPKSDVSDHRCPKKVYNWFPAWVKVESFRPFSWQSGFLNYLNKKFVVFIHHIEPSFR